MYNLKMTKKIIKILEFEALVFFVTTICAYYFIGASWWLFFILLLVPDFFMVGYIKNSYIGATIYNTGHTYVLPVVMIGMHFLFDIASFLPISIIWFAHVSMDRMFGFGLKYDTNFKDTHLGIIEKS